VKFFYDQFAGEYYEQCGGETVVKTVNI